MVGVGRGERVTMHDVALAAGVSIASVSKALSGTGQRRDTTRNRILLAASYVVGDRANNDGSDIFAADTAWWHITLLTIALHGQPWLGQGRQPQR
jgi:hypothetical protein